MSASIPSHTKIAPLAIATLCTAMIALAMPAVQDQFLPPSDTVAQLTAQARAVPPAAEPVIRDEVYHRDLFRRYRLDIYLPLDTAGQTDGGAAPEAGRSEGGAAPDAGPRGAIVFYHGGSWLRGDKVTVMIIHRFLRRMREQGWTVIAVNYTTSALRGIREPVRNAERAYRWVVDHAGDYGWDPERVGLYGVSAGGHVALMTAVGRAANGLQTTGRAEPGESPKPAGPLQPDMAARPQPPAFVLAECAPTDLIAMREGDAGKSSASFRFFPKGRLRALSPVHAIDTLPEGAPVPPVLIYHGDADETVAFHQAELLAAALDRAGAEHTLVRYPGGDHAFLNYSDAQWYEQESRAIRWMGAVFESGRPPARPMPQPAAMDLFR